MKVLVRLQSAAQPIEYDATSAYQKGAFYCVSLGERVVKFPIRNLFSVEEDYGYRSPKAR